jgi:hypothetical protein
MKAIGYILAGTLAVAIAAPSVASAETVVIKRGDGYRGARAEYREHRGWDRGYGWHRHADRMVIIKRHHHHDWD